MAAGDVAIGMIFLSQTVAGILGNAFLLYNYLFLYFTGYKLKFTDLILTHLIVANFLTLLCKGVPQAMAAFGLTCFLSDLGCKLLSYLHRVGRGVSFASTCFLSVFQAITISPRDSMWAEFKSKVPRYIGSSIFLSWILYLLVSIDLLKYMTGRLCIENMTHLKDLGYCSSVRLEKTGEILHALYVTSPDAVCMALMLWASSSMVCILYRHTQRMQPMHRANISPGSSPEIRATQTILFLVSIFVCSYTLSSLFTICLTFMVNPSWLLVNIAAVCSVCFSTFSPFLFMRHGYSAPTLCSTLTDK